MISSVFNSLNLDSIVYVNLILLVVIGFLFAYLYKVSRN